MPMPTLPYLSLYFHRILLLSLAILLSSLLLPSDSVKDSNWYLCTSLTLSVWGNDF